MKTWSLAAIVLACLSLLAGCPAHRSQGCSSQLATIPDGNCSAYYYQSADEHSSALTQALVDCTINGRRLGGNVVSFSSAKHGIGLRWVEPQTLEVAIPEGVKPTSKEMRATYLGHPLTYRYRILQPGEDAYNGCFLPPSGGGA